MVQLFLRLIRVFSQVVIKQKPNKKKLKKSQIATLRVSGKSYQLSDTHILLHVYIYIYIKGFIKSSDRFIKN